MLTERTKPTFYEIIKYTGYGASVNALSKYTTKFIKEVKDAYSGWIFESVNMCGHVYCQRAFLVLVGKKSHGKTHRKDGAASFYFCRLFIRYHDV